LRSNAELLAAPQLVGLLVCFYCLRPTANIPAAAASLKIMYFHIRVVCLFSAGQDQSKQNQQQNCTVMIFQLEGFLLLWIDLISQLLQLLGNIK
jgi:hypothetical protein